MAVKFIHTADWQIGKVYRFVDRETMGLLQEARLNAIIRLGDLAREHSASRVLVAGDVYDAVNLATKSINQPIERMRRYDDVTWHLLPGNHDHYQPNGLWDRLQSESLPKNIKIHMTAEPCLIADECLAILPSPLQFKSSLEDLTAYMDDAHTPHDYVRVGLAHGSVQTFGSDAEYAVNYIDPDRPKKARLNYLALGDWHGQKKINDRCWYSGTPETDSFAVKEGGQALLVSIDGPAAIPSVTPLATGQFSWIELDESIHEKKDIYRLEHRLLKLGNELEQILVQLNVQGTMSLEDSSYFEEKIVERFDAAFCYFQVEDSNLSSDVSIVDLDQIDSGGFVRVAAEELVALAKNGNESDRKVARDALKRLYVEMEKL